MPVPADPYREAARHLANSTFKEEEYEDIVYAALRQAALAAARAEREQTIAALKVWQQSRHDTRWAEEVVTQLPSLVPPAANSGT